MREKQLILLADDDTALSRALQLSLASVFDVHVASTVAQGKALATRNEYEIAVIDLNFEGQDLDGIDLIDHFNKERPGTFLVVLSGDRSVQRAVQAMRRKLFEFVHKEGDFFDSLLRVLNRAAQLKRAQAEGVTRKYLTESPAVLEVLSKVERILRSQADAPILILGETGSGKEFLAQHIASGMRRKLVAANMASIPRETAESVLFGHERGAFTGAVTNKIGLIETATNGIFFLDEIGECSPAVQAKLLRVLQEKEILPLGATSSRKIRVQFLAATHRNLDEMAAAGTFRIDLLQRLNTFVLRLPPLRERPEDILLYANLFLSEFAEEDGPQFTISPEGARALLAYPWPGNIRELRNVVQRFAVLSSKFVLNAAAVQDAIGDSQALISVSAGKLEVLGANVRRDALVQALSESNGNKRIAAKSLGISEATLYRWIQELGLKTLAGNLKTGAVATVGEAR